MHVCYSAGFFWKSNKINSLATNDDSNGVSNKINRGDQLPLRKTYVNYLKEIFNYDNCKN